MKLATLSFVLVTEALDDVTLTVERVIEVAPMSGTRKEQLIQELSVQPYRYIPITRIAFWFLGRWYESETIEIGEERAFWGLVYRLLDNPTKDDINWTRIWLYQYLSVFEEPEQKPSWLAGLYEE